MSKDLAKKKASQLGDLTLASVEKKHICATLKSFSGNKTRAALAMGITIKTLYNKLHSYSLM